MWRFASSLSRGATSALAGCSSPAQFCAAVPLLARGAAFVLTFKNGYKRTADWEAALKGGTRDGAPPRTVSVKGADAPKGDGAKEGGGKKAKRSGKEGGAKAKGGKRKRG